MNESTESKMRKLDQKVADSTHALRALATDAERERAENASSDADPVEKSK